MWFAARVDRLISIEHDAVWYARVQGKLLSRPRNNVNLILTGPDADEYLRPALELEDNSLDFALVDGISTLRDRCAESVIPKIRPGGLLILDDVHRYLPSVSRAPRALPIEAEPSSACWVRVADAVAGWDLIETSSGVTDTDLMRRPE
jgi:predicted O-methyltransferase YrrM